MRPWRKRGTLGKSQSRQPHDRHVQLRHRRVVYPPPIYCGHFLPARPP
ncbi:hypothetical protein XCR_0266 [Xanthomonas campestris pv. raphani 756C]|nr:hypothetical protein XCR_0266 [Xanthomonas campestris pv. raphani 756C]